MRLRLLACTALAVLASPAVARAQSICANFWAPVSGTYGDHCGTTVDGVTTTGTAHDVTGMLQGTSAGTECTTWTFDQVVARIDWWVVGVDPGEEVSFRFNGGDYTLEEGNLHRNPDVTAQELALSNGHLVSAGADGSAYLEIAGGGIMVSYSICTTSDGTHDGVVVRTSTNSFCQCGNAHKHYNEDCDDGDTDNGDGCSAVCAVEEGWTCTDDFDQTSVCTMDPPIDAGVPDAMPIDAMPIDAAVPDAAIPDAAILDAEPTGIQDGDVPAPDGASADGGDDLPPIEPANGCSCQAGSDGAAGTLVLLMAAVAGSLRRRRPYARRSR